MNDASRWRMEVGRRIGMAYAADPKARVVMVAGSTGRGTADRYSDLEIDVYWDEPPTDDERRAAIDRAGGRLLTLFDYEEDEWSEEISFGGFKVGTSTFLVETMERYLTEVIDEFRTYPLPQMRLSSLLHSQTLVGEDLVDRWRAKAAVYPIQLAHAVVAENLDFGLIAYAGDMFAARGDAIVLYDAFVQAERRILGALLGLNGIYLPEPTFKSMDELIGRMRLVPPDLGTRLKRPFRLPFDDGLRELRDLIEETFGLVETQLPDFDTAPYRETLHKARRGAWDAAPDI
jgi:hypothetical protein